MRDGSVRTRSGHRYKPSAIRSYEDPLRAHIRPYLGARRLGDVKRRDVQALVDRLVGDGKGPSTVRNALLPLRVIYRRALRDGVVAVNPCVGGELPAKEEERRTPPSKADAETLLAAVPAEKRALWATALYGGLRKGELRALGWDAVDLAAGVIRVERSMDATGALIAPKSKAGRRTVPIPKVLRGYLLEQKLRNGAEPYVFGRRGKPFPAHVARVGGVGLHACCHAYASFMVAAGVNLKPLSAFMGHSSVLVTADRYSYLYPGSEQEAGGLLDRYLSGGDAKEDAQTS